MFKKLKLFRIFRKTINKNKILLEQKYNIRIDNANRIYTVINIPEELIGESYVLKKSDIDKISENYIRQFYLELGRELESQGLTELFNIYDIKKVNKYSYLLVIGFSLFQSPKYYNYLYYVVIPSIILLSVVSILLLI